MAGALRRGRCLSLVLPPGQEGRRSAVGSYERREPRAMAYDKYRKDTTALVKSTVPEGVDVTSVEFEGPYVVIYTKTIELFADDGEITRRLAQTLRRRVIVRPDPKELIDPAQAEEIIRKLVPAEAEVTNVWFDPATGEVTIEAKSPGASIGR